MNLYFIKNYDEFLYYLDNDEMVVAQESLEPSSDKMFIFKNGDIYELSFENNVYQIEDGKLAECYQVVATDSIMYVAQGAKTYFKEKLQ
jgi:hypothetical protein